MAPLPESADVVVIGAGHNGLVCAAYLAAAGLEVCVLEAREIVGGNTVTEQLTLPGFAHDSCSSAHVLIQSNPLLADDELGLLSQYGLRYETTDPAVVLPQEDGDLLVMSRDLAATADELARFSAADAAAFTELITGWNDGLAAVHGRWNSGLPLGDRGEEYLAMRSGSAWELIHQRFAHPVVRSFVLWLALATIQDPRRPGTGVLPASIAAGRLRFGWATPIGGSGALPAALVRQLAAHGGSVATSAAAAAVGVRDGRAAEVTTVDGRRIIARRAVVSGAHLATLAGMLASPSEDLLRARDSWRPGLSVFAVHAALRGDLRYRGRTAVAAGYGSVEGIAGQLDAFHRGEPDARDPWLLVVDQTVVDPSRAPDGAATVKLLTIAPYERADGRSWDESKDEYAEALVKRVGMHAGGLSPDDILALRAESPVDVAAHNPVNLGGSCHGGEFVTPDGTVIPGWTDYGTGVPGLFLTGATSHPGGSVSGRPGRNAARAVLRALDLDPAAVMGPR
ncbi:MAG TPA: NAD(P)/FAD-dependent oxidoreductase [Mycobacteriales bacterium]|jgi:phytoene dehydrogenase-like protein|nr:NAD(P)/FAD-dependent oxidoreductase [Mycobacteriales bacterium]